MFDVYFTIVHNTFAVSLYLLIHLSICKILLQVDLSVHETRAELYPAGEITLPEGSRWIFTHFHQCILCMLCIFVIYIDYFAGREPLDSHSFSFWTTAYFAYSILCIPIILIMRIHHCILCIEIILTISIMAHLAYMQGVQ